MKIGEVKSSPVALRALRSPAVDPILGLTEEQIEAFGLCYQIGTKRGDYSGRTFEEYVRSQIARYLP